MGNILDVNFGLVFWTLVNFVIFLFLLLKFGTKPIANALKTREEIINNSIANAEKANEEAKAILSESQQKISSAQVQANDIIIKGKAQVELIISKAKDEAETVKNQRIADAAKEINRYKESAIIELRTEVADLVIQATEKVLNEKLDPVKDLKLVETSINSIEKINKN
jgi:F-type H+-transporting ATPase subunit b